MQTLVVRCLRARLPGGYNDLKPTTEVPDTSIMVESESSAHLPARQASCDARASPSPIPLTKPGPPRGSSRVGLFGATWISSPELFAAGRTREGDLVANEPGQLGARVSAHSSVRTVRNQVDFLEPGTEREGFGVVTTVGIDIKSSDPRVAGRARMPCSAGGSRLATGAEQCRCGVRSCCERWCLRVWRAACR